MEKDDDESVINQIDYIKISELLIISYLLRTGILFFIILSFSFFSAMIFRIFLGIEHDLYKENDSYIYGDCSTDAATGYFK